jgi:hypothetical protein
MQGPEEAFELGEAIARTIFQPVMRSHRCTVEQMAILEPVLLETVLASCLTVIGRAVTEAVRRGVPVEAARDFVLGHLRVEVAIVFQEQKGAAFSDGSLKAIEAAIPQLFRPTGRRFSNRRRSEIVFWPLRGVEIPSGTKGVVGSADPGRTRALGYVLPSLSYCSLSTVTGRFLN